MLRRAKHATLASFVAATCLGGCSLDRRGTFLGSVFEGGVHDGKAGEAGGAGTAATGAGGATAGAAGRVPDASRDGAAGMARGGAGGIPPDASSDGTSDGPVLTPLGTNDGRPAYGRQAAQDVHIETWLSSPRTWLVESNVREIAGEARWVVARIAPGSHDGELIAVIPSSASPELSMFRRTGNEAALDWSTTSVLSAYADVRGFDVEYEATSAEPLIVYSDGTSTPVYRARSGGLWTTEKNFRSTIMSDRSRTST